MPPPTNDDCHTVTSAGNASVNTLAAFLLDSASQPQADDDDNGPSLRRDGGRTTGGGTGVETPEGPTLEDLRQRQMEGRAAVNALNQFILQAGNIYRGRRLSKAEAGRLREVAARVGLSMEVVDALLEQTADPNAVVEYCLTSDDAFARRVKQDPHLSRMLEGGAGFFQAGPNGLNLSDSVWRVFMHKIMQQFLREHNMELGDVMDKSSLTSRLYAEAFRDDAPREDDRHNGFETYGTANYVSEISRDYTEERKRVMISESEAKQARLEAESNVGFQSRTLFHDLIKRNSFYASPQGGIHQECRDDDDLSVLQVGATRDDAPSPPSSPLGTQSRDTPPKKIPIPARTKGGPAMIELGGQESAVKRGLAMFEKAGSNKGDDDAPQKLRRKSEYNTRSSNLMKALAVFEKGDNATSIQENPLPSLDVDEKATVRRKSVVIHKIAQLESQRATSRGNPDLGNRGNVAQDGVRKFEKLQAVFSGESDMSQKSISSKENNEPPKGRRRSLASRPVSAAGSAKGSCRGKGEPPSIVSLRVTAQAHVETMPHRSVPTVSRQESMGGPPPHSQFEGMGIDSLGMASKINPTRTDARDSDTRSVGVSGTLLQPSRENKRNPELGRKPEKDQKQSATSAFPADWNSAEESSNDELKSSRQECLPPSASSSDESRIFEERYVCYGSRNTKKCPGGPFSKFSPIHDPENAAEASNESIAIPSTGCNGVPREGHGRKDSGNNTDVNSRLRETPRISSGSAFSRPDTISIESQDDPLARQVYSGLTQSSDSSEEGIVEILSTAEEDWKGGSGRIRLIATTNRRQSYERRSSKRRSSLTLKDGAIRSSPKEMTSDESNPSDETSWAGFGSNNVFRDTALGHQHSSDRLRCQVRSSTKSIDRIEKSRFDNRSKHSTVTKTEGHQPSSPQGNALRGRPEAQHGSQILEKKDPGSAKATRTMNPKNGAPSRSTQPFSIALIPPSPAVVTNVTSCTSYPSTASSIVSMPFKENSWIQFPSIRGASSARPTEEWMKFDNDFKNAEFSESQPSLTSSSGLVSSVCDNTINGINKLSTQSSDEKTSSVSKSRQYFEKLLRNEIAPPLASFDSYVNSSSTESIPIHVRRRKSRIGQSLSCESSGPEETCSQSRPIRTQKDSSVNVANAPHKNLDSWEAFSTNFYAEESPEEPLQEKFLESHNGSSNQSREPWASNRIDLDGLNGHWSVMTPFFPVPNQGKESTTKLPNPDRQPDETHGSIGNPHMMQLSSKGEAIVYSATNPRPKVRRVERHDQKNEFGFGSTNGTIIGATQETELVSESYSSSTSHLSSAAEWVSEGNVSNQPNESKSGSGINGTGYRTRTSYSNESLNINRQESASRRGIESGAIPTRTEESSRESSEESDSNVLNPLSNHPTESHATSTIHTDSEVPAWYTFGSGDESLSATRTASTAARNQKEKESKAQPNDDFEALQEFRRRRASISDGYKVKPGIVKQKKRILEGRLCQEEQFDSSQDPSGRIIRVVDSDEYHELNAFLDDYQNDGKSCGEIALPPPTPIGLNRRRTVNQIHEMQVLSEEKSDIYSTQNPRSNSLAHSASGYLSINQKANNGIHEQYDDLEVKQSSSSLSRLLTVDTASTEDDDVGLNSTQEVDWPLNERSKNLPENRGRLSPTVFRSGDSVSDEVDEAEIRAAAKQSGIPSCVVDIILSQSRENRNHAPVAKALTGVAKYDSDTCLPASTRHLNRSNMSNRPDSAMMTTFDATKYDHHNFRGLSSDKLVASPCGGTRHLHDYHQQLEKQRDPRPDPSPNAMRGAPTIPGLEIPEGASEEEIKLLNRFIEVASGDFGGNKLSAESESRVRFAAVKIGLTPKFVDQLLYRQQSAQKTTLANNSAAPFTFEQRQPQQPTPQKEQYHNYHADPSSNHRHIDQHHQEPSTPYTQGGEASTYFTVDYTRTTKQTKKTDTTEADCNVWESLKQNLAYLTKQMPTCGNADDASSISSAPSWDDNAGVASNKRRKKHRTLEGRRQSSSRKVEDPRPHEQPRRDDDEQRGEANPVSLPPNDQPIRGLV